MKCPPKIAELHKFLHLFLEFTVLMYNSCHCNDFVADIRLQKVC